MTKDLKERIAEEWAMLDPVDPLRRLLSDVIDVLAQPAQEPVGKWTGKEIEWSDNPYKFKQGQFIYTAPQPRLWIGLTDEDARIAALEVPWRYRLAFDAGMLAAANILKGKNHGAT